MAQTKVKVGDIVHIVFWDHAENFTDAMQFEVFGQIQKITRKAYIIHSWQYHDPLQRATDRSASDNETSFAIVKKTVDSIKKLK